MVAFARNLAVLRVGGWLGLRVGGWLGLRVGG
jgi:hypothetical protein